MTRVHPLAWITLALLATGPLTAAEDGTETSAAERGAAKAIVCSACHGVDGNSVNPEWPSLAGQNAAYITEQLGMFRANHRGISANSMVMMSQAIMLTDDDIKELAAYFAAQTPTGLEADPSYWEAGEQIYRHGDRTRDVPACMACHGPVGGGNAAAGYPALRAQHSVYTVKQLTEYAGGVRYADAAGEVHATRNSQMMTTIAKRLTDEDIRNLASYLQGLR